MRNFESFLLCPRCKSKLVYLGAYCKCKCSEYPFVAEILYLKKDRLAKKALIEIKDKNNKSAVVTLLNLRFKLKLVFLFFFIYFPIFKCVGFQSMVHILSNFSLDKKWGRYLIKREKIPSFYYSLAILGLIKKNEILLDIGCGMGNMLSIFEKKQAKVIGIDSSFLNLFLARQYFTNRDTLLICCNVEKGLPFKNNKVNIVHSNDTFHYLKDKENFLRDCKRVLSNRGFLAILQNVSSKQGNIKGVSTPTAAKLFKKSGFNNFAIYSNKDLLDIIKRGDNIETAKSSVSNELRSCCSYSIFASLAPGNKIINISRAQSNRLKNVSLDYSYEPWLKTKA